MKDAIVLNMKVKWEVVTERMRVKIYPLEKEKATNSSTLSSEF